MQRSNRGESKQGLTVTLVLFVFLSVILGIVAYVNWSSSVESEKKIADLEKAKKDWETDRTALKLQLSVDRIIIGIGTAEDKQIVDGNKAMKEGTVFESETKKFQPQDLSWDKEAEEPAKTYITKIKELSAELSKANAATKAANDEKEANHKKFEQDRAAFAKEKADLVKKLDETKDEIKKTVDTLNANVIATLDRFKKNMDDHTALSAENIKLKDAGDKMQEKHKLEMLKVLAENQRLQKLIPPDKVAGIDMLALDRPKGKITRLDHSGSIAYINLGRADNVQPGLTFAVFGPGDSKGNAQPKGKLEVVRVIASHQSMARVTETANPTRDPLIANDDLYNPSWMPGQHEHIAIAGMIDLLGDGHDQSALLRRNLEAQGTIIDAYIDMQTLKVKGLITQKTTYLVKGSYPDIATGKGTGIQGGEDPRQKAGLEVKKRIKEMEAEARTNGVTIVEARKFLALIGYRLPRVSSPEGSSTYNLRTETFDDKKDNTRKMTPPPMPAK